IVCVAGNVLDAQTVLAVQQLFEANQAAHNERVLEAASQLAAGEEEEEEDTFQCGRCKRKFTALPDYFAHKKEPCAGKLPTSLCDAGTTSAVIVGDRISSSSQVGAPFDLFHQGLPQSARVILSEADLLALSGSLEASPQLELQTTEAGGPSHRTLEGSPTRAESQAATTLSLYAQPLETATSTASEMDEKMAIGEGTVMQMVPVNSLLDSSELRVQVDEKGVEFIVAHTEQTSEQSADGHPTSMAASASRQRRRTHQHGSDGTSSHKRLLKSQKCPFCSKAFSKNFDLQQHIRSHTGEKPFQCVICGRGFAQKSNVKKHMQTHKVWPDGLAHTLPAPVVSDGSQSSIDEPNPKEDGPGTEKVRENGGDVLLLDNSYSCPFCTFVGKSYFELKSHLKHHKQEKVFKCIVGKCGEMFTDLESFLGHAKSHENNMMYRCPHCPKTLPSLYDLNIHQLTHTLCVTSDSSSISVTIGSNGSSGRKPHARIHRCSHCLNRYATPEALAHHQATCSHNYPCPVCQKVFPCERYLRRHLLIHRSSSPHVCSVCHKGFKTDHYLKVHAVVHSSEKPFLCSQCGATFNRQDKLKRHYLVHETVKRYKCPYGSHLGCQKEFSRADKLKAHLLTHSGVRPYECHTCGRGFTQKQRLREHERLHTDVRSFFCSTCQQGFVGRKALEEHACPGRKPKRQTALRSRRRRFNGGRPAILRQQRLARARVAPQEECPSDAQQDVPTAHIEIISATGDLDTALAQAYQPVDDETGVDAMDATGAPLLFRAVQGNFEDRADKQSDWETKDGAAEHPVIG
ncbi:unnamed protein product, partial [Ixodes hexagonus]